MKTILSAAVTLSLLILSIGSMKADPLDNWTFSRMPTNSPGSLQLFSIAYGYGRYVGVGEYFGDDNGFIETSEDGTNWTMRSQHDFSILDLFDVTFGNGMFVAVGWNFFGGRNIYSSTNGVDWSPHTTAMANVVAVSYGEGMYVAVGDGNNLNSSTISSNNVYYSFDGTTWMATDSGFPASATQTLKDVAYGNGRFIAVDQAHHIYSLFESIITNNLAGSMVSFCNDRFFIPAGPGTNLVSMNGLSWSALTNNTGSSFRHVVYLSGMFVALGNTNLFTSTDGTNWVQRNLPPPSNVTLADLAVGDRNMVVAEQAPAAYVSDPFVALNLGIGFPPQLTLSGLTGRTYRVETTTNLISISWQPLTNFILTNGPVTWMDTTATDSCRFYRAALLP